MKGISFQKPLELCLQVDGESWRQGDPIQGQLTIKNRGSSAVDLAGMAVTLACGELKKVRLKSPKAFDNISSTPLSHTTSLAPGAEETLPWKFETDRNCQITDTSRSLFLLYGQGEASEKLGQLQLTVHPFWIIHEFVDVLKVGFRFVVKTQKASKGWVEIKLAAPDAKGFASVEHLVLYFQFEGETLAVQILFHLKKMEATARGVEVKKLTFETEQSYGPERYRTLSGRFDHESVEAGIREALAQVDSKLL